MADEIQTAPAAPQQGDDEPLRCDYCQCELTNPWHGSGIIEGKERRHIHACDACRGKLPGAVECESCRSGNGGYEALYRHACLEVRRLVNDLLAERNGVFPELVSHAFITSESGNDQYRVVMKFESLAQMQAAHNYLARLNRNPIPLELLKELHAAASKLHCLANGFSVSGVYFNEFKDNEEALLSVDAACEEFAAQLRALLGKEGE